jgi:hypothetical protein
MHPEHLADDGRLIFNIFDPSLDMIVSSLGLGGTSLKRDSEFIHPETGNQVIVWYSVNMTLRFNSSMLFHLRRN